MTSGENLSEVRTTADAEVFDAFREVVVLSQFNGHVSPEGYRSLQAASRRLIRAVSKRMSPDEIREMMRQDLESEDRTSRKPESDLMTHLDSLLHVAEMKRDFAVNSQWNKQVKNRYWLIQDWLAEGRVTLFTGEGGAGKSWLVLQMAAALASGQADFMPSSSGMLNAPSRGSIVARPGLARMPKQVVFASYEDEEDEFVYRLAQMERTTNSQLNRVNVSRFLHYIDMSGEGPLWAPERGSRHVSTMAELTETGKRLREFAEAVQASLLIIDPLAAAYASNENERGMVRAYMGDWDRWARDNECAVLMIAHPSKSSNEYSGSTDWPAAARAAWMLREELEPNKRNNPDSCMALTSLKSNYGARPSRVWLERYNGVWQEKDPPMWAT